MSKYRTRRTSKRGVNMFTTSLAAHAAYAAPAEPRTRRQRQHPLSSTRPHARRSTLVVAAPAAASAAPIHALESRRALAESRASRRRTTVAHGLPIPIIGGLFNGPRRCIWGTTARRLATVSKGVNGWLMARALHLERVVSRKPEALDVTNESAHSPRGRCDS